MGPLVVVVLGLLAIATVRLLADRIGVAAPLLLVLLGVGVALLPGVPVVEIEPEWILAGILPPLLFSSAVAMPAMEFRRAFGAVSGLSVLLVVLSAGVIGLLLTVLVPDLGLAGGIALGAILSPTDAAATAIVRRTRGHLAGGHRARGRGSAQRRDRPGAPARGDRRRARRRCRSAGCSASSRSPWSSPWSWASWSAGSGSWSRRPGRATPPSTPSCRSRPPSWPPCPPRRSGRPGLVAAVAAGLVTGHGAIRHLSPQHRLSDKENWRTVELVLEGTIFLLMGLQLAGVLEELHRDGGSVGPGLGIAAVALVATVAVRSGYVSALVVWLRSCARRGTERLPTLSDMDAAARGGRAGDDPGPPGLAHRTRGALARVPRPAAAPDRRHRLLPRRAPRAARGHGRSCGRACAAR